MANKIQDFNLAIMGIGSIGGIISQKLYKVGLQPYLFTNNTSITGAIKANGIVLNGESIYIDNVNTKLEEISDETRFDSILLVMKANNVVNAVKQAMNYLKSSGYVVTLQNGIVEDKVGKIVGEHRIISGIIAFGGTMVDPGQYTQTTSGSLHLGELTGEITPRLVKLATYLEKGLNINLSTNIRGKLWAKLAINCSLNSMSALTGLKIGELFKTKKIRNILFQTYSETIDLAQILDIKPEKIAVNPYLFYINEDTSSLVKLIKDTLTIFLRWRYRHSKASTLQSIEQGKKSEIDYINGFVVNKAEKINFNVPMNSIVYDMIKQIEDNDREIGVQNIAFIDICS